MSGVVLHRVIIESPFAADDEATRRKYRSYLRRAILHSVHLGEAPFASHGFYTQFLDDVKVLDRIQGMAMGFCWMEKAQLVAVYADYGISRGMADGLANAARLKIPTSFRYILGARTSNKR